MIIEWRNIKGYEGIYQISNDGRVLNVKTGRVRKNKVAKNGYCIIDLWRDCQSKWFRVHRLVAEAFVENPNDLDVVMHKDNNKSNNIYSNLIWGTTSENTQQAFNDGLIDTNDYYILTKDETRIEAKGRKELIELTGYSSSSLDTYIKSENPLRKGRYKGFKIEKDKEKSFKKV